MSVRSRRWRLAGLLAAALVSGAGCNLAALSYYLYPGADTVPPAPGMKLASDDKKQEVKVVILTSSGVETRPEFATAEYELTTLLTRQLQAAFKENKEKVTVIAPAKVREFKNNHPDWHTMPLVRVGKRFDADFVISLEINHLSLYDETTANQLYKGRAEISVKLVNVNKPEEDPIDQEFRDDYPPSLTSVPVEDKPMREFQLEFMNDVARKLSWYFTEHPRDHEFPVGR